MPQQQQQEEELEQEAPADDGFVLRCLRALDMHVIGACRADERLTPLPLLKLNAGIPTGQAEDRLMAQLIQHFEVSEIGLLARCLCVPLVSIRVGKINKQGTLLCPTAARGHLNVNILPSSCLRISYVGDDGQTVPLAVISNDDDDLIIIDEISSDTSGRSFSLSLPHSNHFYYWLSEKSLSEGIHLLHKMKDILERKVTLSDVTGISNSRLESFGTHLKAYLLGSSASKSQSEQQSSSLSPVNNVPRPTTSRNRHSKNPNLRSRSIVSFKDAGASSSSSSSTSKISFARGDKSKRRNNNNSNNNNSELLLNIGSAIPSLPIVSCPLPLPTIPSSSSSSSSSSSDPFALPADILPHFSPFDPITFKFPHPPPPNNNNNNNNNNNKPKPYYCWCPMGSSSDPLESMSMSPVVPPIGPGLMSEPIVHIPIMDVRSSGQAYLVSAGPMISTAVVVPTTTTESNARETLRHLLESAPSDLTPHPIHTVITGISEIRFYSSSSPSSSPYSPYSSLEGDNVEGDDEDQISSGQEDDQIQEK